MGSDGAKAAWKVWLYVPNLIGYTRIALAIISFIYYRSPYIFLGSYALSYLLDALDGTMARLLNQGSRFGAVLDMVTDRASTLGLYMILGHLYPKKLAIFCMAAGLDLCSHFTQMYQSLVCGSDSHKKIAKDKSWILRAYYHDRRVLFLVCFGQEAFLLGLYLLHFWMGTPLIKMNFPWESEIDMRLFTLDIPTSASLNLIECAILLFAPIYCFKQYVNLIQWFSGAHSLARLDASSKPTANKPEKEMKSD